MVRKIELQVMGSRIRSGIPGLNVIEYFALVALVLNPVVPALILPLDSNDAFDGPLHVFLGESETSS
jgi:hypothetical protein